MNELKLPLSEIKRRTGVAIPTLSRWCRTGKFPNAAKEKTVFGEFWLVPESDLTAVASQLENVKRGRPKKED